MSYLPQFSEAEEDLDLDLLAPEKPGWEMKKLKPVHKQVCSLYAQGLKNVDIARLVGIVPEYIPALMKQPLCREYVAKINAVAGLQLEAQFQLTVDVIGDTLRNGSAQDQLKAARLQLEATKRIGSGSVSSTITVDASDRLLKLSERLTGLLTQRQGETIDADFTEVQSADQGQLGFWPS